MTSARRYRMTPLMRMKGNPTPALRWLASVFALTRSSVATSSGVIKSKLGLGVRDTTASSGCSEGSRLSPDGTRRTRPCPRVNSALRCSLVALSQRADPLTRLIAERVALYRKRSGLNQEQLGQKMAELGTGWTRSTVVKFENLNRESVSVSDLLALARALDLPPTWLLADVEKGEPTPVTKDFLADPWDALLWMGGRMSLDEEAGDWWSRVAPSIGRIYSVAGAVEQIRRNRIAHTFLSTTEDLEEHADSEDELAEKDRRLFRSIVSTIKEIVKSGLVAPVLPDDIQDRARELGIVLPGRGE